MEKETYILPTTAQADIISDAFSVKKERDGIRPQADIISDAFSVKKERDGIRLLPVPSPPLSVLSNVSLGISVFTVFPTLNIQPQLSTGTTAFPSSPKRKTGRFSFLSF